MHRDHGHCAGHQIAVRLALFRNVIRWMQALPAQPVSSACSIEPLSVHGVLHQACALLQISQEASAGRQVCQGFPFQQLGQAAHQSEPRQGIGEGLELGGELVELPVPIARFQSVGRPLHQGSCRQSAQSFIVRWAGQTIEEPLQFIGSTAAEHIPWADQAAGQPHP